MVKPTLTDLNPVNLNYYLFMISLDKCRGSCNVVDDLSTKICIPSKVKDVNVKVFNMITRRNETCDCKFRFSSTTCNSNQKWNNDTMLMYM